jgi:hypothetical protein
VTHGCDVEPVGGRKSPDVTRAEVMQMARGIQVVPVLTKDPRGKAPVIRHDEAYRSVHLDGIPQAYQQEPRVYYVLECVPAAHAIESLVWIDVPCGVPFDHTQAARSSNASRLFRHLDARTVPALRLGEDQTVTDSTSNVEQASMAPWTLASRLSDAGSVIPGWVHMGKILL